MTDRTILLGETVQLLVNNYRTIESTEQPEAQLNDLQKLSGGLLIGKSLANGTKYSAILDQLYGSVSNMIDSLKQIIDFTSMGLTDEHCSNTIFRPNAAIDCDVWIDDLITGKDEANEILTNIEDNISVGNGIQVNNCFLFHGPSGIGKSTVAKAISNELQSKYNTSTTIPRYKLVVFKPTLAQDTASKIAMFNDIFSCAIKNVKTNESNTESISLIFITELQEFINDPITENAFNENLESIRYEKNIVVLATTRNGTNLNDAIGEKFSKFELGYPSKDDILSFLKRSVYNLVFGHTTGDKAGIYCKKLKTANDETVDTKIEKAFDMYFPSLNTKDLDRLAQRYSEKINQLTFGVVQSHVRVAINKALKRFNDYGFAIEHDDTVTDRRVYLSPDAFYFLPNLDGENMVPTGKETTTLLAKIVTFAPKLEEKTLFATDVGAFKVKEEAAPVEAIRTTPIRCINITKWYKKIRLGSIDVSNNEGKQQHEKTSAELDGIEDIYIYVETPVLKKAIYNVFNKGNIKEMTEAFKTKYATIIKYWKVIGPTLKEDASYEDIIDTLTTKYQGLISEEEYKSFLKELRVFSYRAILSLSKWALIYKRKRTINMMVIPSEMTPEILSAATSVSSYNTGTVWKNAERKLAVLSRAIKDSGEGSTLASDVNTAFRNVRYVLEDTYYEVRRGGKIPTFDSAKDNIAGSSWFSIFRRKPNPAETAVSIDTLDDLISFFATANAPFVNTEYYVPIGSDHDAYWRTMVSPLSDKYIKDIEHYPITVNTVLNAIYDSYDGNGNPTSIKEKNVANQEVSVGEALGKWSASSINLYASITFEKSHKKKVTSNNFKIWNVAFEDFPSS